MLAAENFETTVETETVTAVSQQTSEFDEDEDEVTPVTDSQTHTGLSVQSFVQQLGISSWHSTTAVIIVASYRTLGHVPSPLPTTNFFAHFGAAQSL